MNSNSPQPTITAVVTTYQRPELVRRAVRSVVTQRRPPNEIIVVEDGPGADTEAWLVREFGRGIQYVRHEGNQGLAAARNTGLRISTGRYIAYLDDDDEWLPERLESQVLLLRDSSPEELAVTGVVYGGIQVIDPDSGASVIRRPRNHGNLRDAIISAGFNTLSSTFLFKADALRGVGGFDEHLSSSIDHDIWMALAAAGWNVSAVESALVRTYTQIQNGRMTTDPDRRIAGVQQFLDKWRSTLLEWLGPVETERFVERYFSSVVGAYAAQALWQGDIHESWQAAHAVVQRAANRRAAAAIVTRKLLAGGFRRFAPGALNTYLRIRRESRARKVRG